MGSGIVFSETDTSERFVSRAPCGRSWVMKSAAVAPASASTSTTTAARIQARALGMERRPSTAAGRQCASRAPAGTACLKAPARDRDAGHDSRGEAEHAPGQRILEEPRVQE